MSKTTAPNKEFTTHSQIELRITRVDYIELLDKTELWLLNSTLNLLLIYLSLALPSPNSGCSHSPIARKKCFFRGDIKLELHIRIFTPTQADAVAHKNMTSADETDIATQKNQHTGEQFSYRPSFSSPSLCCASAYTNTELCTIRMELRLRSITLSSIAMKL